jgi:hypothetical protein
LGGEGMEVVDCRRGGSRGRHHGDGGEAKAGAGWRCSVMMPVLAASGGLISTVRVDVRGKW